MNIKYLFFIASVLFTMACNENKDSQVRSSHKTYSLVDTSQQPLISKDKNIDFEIEEPVKKRDISYVYWDTVGVNEGPVKVTKAWVYRREYSNYKDIAVTYKNVSDKKITAISFGWYGETAFGDPADMGNYAQEGFGGGFTENTLKPGASRTSEWNILSKNAKKVIRAWPTEVMFEDGTKWKSTYKSP